MSDEENKEPTQGNNPLPNEPPADFNPEPPQFQHSAYAAPQYAPPQQPAQQYAPPVDSPQFQQAHPYLATDASPIFQNAANPGPPQYAPPGVSYLPQYILATPGPGGYFNGAADPQDLARPLYGATFAQAVKRFFKGYFKFSGRASKSEYWWSVLFMTLVSLATIAVSMFLIFTIFFASVSNSGFVVATAITSIFLVLLLPTIAFFIPSLAVGWRRLQDANMHGALILLTLIPYIGWIFAIVLPLMPSRAEGRIYDKQ